VHIKRYAAEDMSILVPAIWRRTPTGKNSLTAEGLSSLLPYKPKKAEDAAEKGCLGRAWFAEKLAEKLTREKGSDLIKEAVAWDLEGV
jgi:hypothetical protein